jgi:peptidase E
MASRLLLMGGHEFDQLDGNEVLTDLILELAGSDSPKVCLLPTASGDPDHQITRFRRAFGCRGADATDISLFRLGQNPIDLEAHLFSQDVVYVGGGSLVNLVAVWGPHGVYDLLREALGRGVLICGQSAGAICWFEQGITTSSGVPAMADGFGHLPGSLCVHYHRDPERRTAYLAAVAAGASPGFGADDQTGLFFEGGQLTRAVSARSGAGVWRVDAQDGQAVETPVEVDDISRRLEESPVAASSSIDDFRALSRFRNEAGLGRRR